MGFWNAPINLAKKAVGKATNSKMANAIPGGSAIGKSLRNAPGMKQSPQPVGPPSPIGPSPQATQQLVNATPTPPPPAPVPQMEPANNAQMGLAVGDYRNRGTMAGQDMSWMDQPGAIQTGPSPQGPQPDMNAAPQMGVGPSPQRMNQLLGSVGNSAFQANNMRNMRNRPMPGQPMGQMM